MKRIPLVWQIVAGLLLGVLIGFAMAFFFGVVDTAKIAAAPWFTLPNFTAPEFNWL